MYFSTCGMLPEMLLILGSKHFAANQRFLNAFKTIVVSVDFTATLAIATVRHEYDLEKMYLYSPSRIGVIRKSIVRYILLLKTNQSLCIRIVSYYKL